MNFNDIAVIILAGGKGTRMNSQLPKVLHEIGGKPMILWTLEKLESMGFGQIVIVVGFGADQVQNKINLLSQSDNKLGNKYTYALQFEQMGTADAVSTGLSKLDPKFETILVLNGDDSGFYNPQTLNEFIKFHVDSGNTISAMTVNSPETKVARVIRDASGNFEKVLEIWEYETSGLKSDEVNCGTYLFQTTWLKRNIGKIDNNNDKKEYRLPEALSMAKQQNLKVGLFTLKNPKEWVGVNTQEDLQKANELLGGK